MHISLCIYIRTFTHAYISVYIYSCIHAYTYIHIHFHKRTQNSLNIVTWLVFWKSTISYICPGCTSTHNHILHHTITQARMHAYFLFLFFWTLLTKSVSYFWHPWLIRDIPMTHSLHTHDSFATYSWLIRDLPMAHSWHTHDSLGALVTSSWHLQVMRDSLLTHDSCKTHLWLVRDSCAKCPWLIRVLTDFSFLNWTHSHEEDSFLLKKHNGTHSWLMPQAQLIRDTRVTPVWNMHDSFVAHALCWSINCGIYSWRPWLTRDSLLIH